jgi:hypothetical protein
VAARGAKVSEAAGIAVAGTGRGEGPGSEEAVAACGAEIGEAARTVAGRAGNPGGEEAVGARGAELDEATVRATRGDVATRGAVGVKVHLGP